MRDTIDMAREAGFVAPVIMAKLAEFAALVRADEQKKWTEQTMIEINEAILEEREACAKVCDEAHELMNSSFQGAAAAIRERSANERARGENK